MSEFPPGPDAPKNPIAVARYFQRINEDPLSFVGERFATFGDMYYAPIRGQHLFVTRHPDHFEEILLTHQKAFEKTTTGVAAKRLNKLLGNGLVNSNGDVWRKHRRMVNPGLSRKKIKGYAETIVAYTNRMLDGWANGQRVDIGRELTELTLRIVTKVLFDHDAGDSVDRVHGAMEAFKDSGGIGVLLPDWVPWPANRRFDDAIDTVDEIIFQMVEERRKVPDEELAERDDLLSALILATDEDGGAGLSDQELRDELLTLFFAGHETTSNGLLWTFYLLSQHSEVGEWVQDELDGFDDDLSYADFSDMPRTRALFDESMRLYPPVCVISRTATEDVEIGGWNVPAGSEVLLYFYWAHNDERWFEAPDDFRPQRFLVETDRPKLAFMPFGGGQRTCIGKHFAMMEAALILGTVLRRHRLEFDSSEHPRPRLTVTLSPADAVWMRVQPAR